MFCRHLGRSCPLLQRAMEALHQLVGRVTGHARPDSRPPSTVKGVVVLVEKSVLDFNPLSSYEIDRVGELLGRKVSFQLVSATVGDQNLGGKGKMGKESYMTKGLEETTDDAVQVKEGESVFEVTFEWDAAVLGTPGAVIVRNNHHSEFHLRSLTLHDIPTTTETTTETTTTIHFACNSWVYPTGKYSYDRVFFANLPYLPCETPEPLRRYREEELLHLRGDDVTRQLEEWDRVYGYAYYNDLGSPDDGPDHSRPVLGGSEHYPYPRRGRTNRPPTRSDPNTESRLPLLSLNIYVPRDERFGHLKMSDFLAYALKALAQSFVPLLHTFFDKSPGEFDSFQDIMKLYEQGLQMPESTVPEGIKDLIPFELIRELVRMDGTPLLKLPMPQVIQADRSAWRTDEEFGREMLAGVNPVMISCLKEFPPVSKLDPLKYGQQHSSITQAHILRRLEGLTVEQAINNNRLFILDYHDILMPYLTRINSTSNKVYASRTILFLKEDGTLKPLAIELSLPHPDGESHGAISKVFTPAKYGTRGSLWELAKAYVAVNDSGYHQLISHWLNTHASMEPFVIATHRQLSVIHPINKLLIPHYRDTMNINALARQILINAGGLFEKTVFADKYALEMSSMVYRNWKFTEQGLPADLLKRGIAVQDADNPSSIRLLIKDYPFANDGLSIWYAIEKWVQEYCRIYYTTDDMVVNDKELQAWWKEIREVGHGDKKDETWWPKMHTIHDLTQTCTTIIWVASALHAAVNFGQYPYAGYLPNRPTISRRFMPQPRTLEFVELRRNPDKVFLQTITGQLQAILGISLIEILSKHSSDEVYLGQRDTIEWTTDRKALEAFERFRKELIEIEKRIMDMNQDEQLKNRNGPVKMPYTLLFPNTSDQTGVGGLTGKGIPNSISI